MKRWAAAFCAVAIASVVIAASVASGRPILASRWSLLWLLVGWGVLWVVGVAASLRLPTRLALPLIFIAAIAIRVGALAGAPTTSDDLYRYSWDGQVQAAGVDPYRYAPNAPQLVGLRDPWLWPDATQCRGLQRPAGCTRINRPAVRTIYPPGAEAWFGAVHRIAGLGARYKSWQVAGLLVEVATISLLAVGARRWGQDPRWVALYALCPAPVLEFVNNGHVDGLAVALIAAAFVVAAGPVSTRRRLVGPGRDVAIGVLLGAACLVKLYPVVLLVVLPCLPRTRPWLSALRSALAAGVVAVIGYLPHVLGVGVHVLGYLPGYLKEEHYDKGGRFLLVGALGIRGRAAAVVAVVVVAGAVTWVVRWRPPAPRGAAVLLATLLFVATPVQPWYAVSLLAIATLVGWPWWSVVVAAGYPYFFAVILDYRHTVAVGRLSHGAALLVVLVAGLWPLLNKSRWQPSIGRISPKIRTIPPRSPTSLS